MTQTIIKPQKGPQEMFMSTSADIAGYGGAAGGGKTWTSLVEPLRHRKHATFGAVIFRRSHPEIVNQGGLWDESNKLYPKFGGIPKRTLMEWQFKTGMRVRFAHLQYDSTVYDWQGSQVPLFIFEELTHFTEFQFFYMMSRIRATAEGEAPTGYVRATFNPDALSWVKKFFAPWVDKKYPDPAESGELRWMVRKLGVIHWYHTREEAVEANPPKIEYDSSGNEVEDETRPKSVTFIRSTVFDNQEMLRQNPDYVSWLRSLPPVEQARLLYGDWDIVPGAGKVFNQEWFQKSKVKKAPHHRDTVLNAKGQVTHYGDEDEVRYWDFAATEKEMKGNDPDWTVGTKYRRIGDQYFIVDVIYFQEGPAVTDQIVAETAELDGVACKVRWEEEGGASGKRDSYHLSTKLDRYDSMGVRSVGDKAIRARGVASQSRAGNVHMVEGVWNDDFLINVHHFPDAPHDDHVDSLSGAHNVLTMEEGDVTTTTNPYDL